MADTFLPPPAPKTDLGRYRILSSTAGIRVSPLVLGGMSIGEAWKGAVGAMNKENSYKLLDAFRDAGGNFIDTANNYQNDESEEWIGDWMKERDIRDQMVIATKYTTAYRSHAHGKDKGVNYSGNSKLSLHLSVRDSLKKLKTDWIDILYLHWWDNTTSIHEVMDSLHILVQQGKVLYLGISDTPAWVVSAGNEYAKAHGKTPFSIYEGRWNVMLRDFERDILPMAVHYGMALCPWDAIGGGKFQTKKQLEERKKAQEGLRAWSGTQQTEQEVKVSEALEKVAGELGKDIPITAVALAYLMHKAPKVFPLVGGRKVEHLIENIEALKLKLSPRQIEELESATSFDIGFPVNFIGVDPKFTGKPGGILAATATVVFPKENSVL